MIKCKIIKLVNLVICYVWNYLTVLDRFRQRAVEYDVPKDVGTGVGAHLDDSGSIP